ncbi:acyltransferase domain-containing protein [Nonomuraea sp. NPDC001023]|uniref:acyltransferase domain-containing protein n=1 Tax=unclassified Nonomuraea TaxID=2593643 RepID=UPI00331F41E4
MRSKVVAVFPGSVAMPAAGVLAPLAARTPAVQELLPEIDAVAAEYGSPPLSAYLLTPDAPRPPGPESHYLALMAVSLAAFDTLVREGLQPYALVGHGLGELWALVAAGVLSAGDGARLACARSRALTGLDWPGTMMSLDVSAVQARRLVALLDHPHLVVGCDDTPRRCVLSGPRELMPQAARIAGHLGWTSAPLQVPHPAHTPAVAAAAAELRGRLPGVRTAPARWPLFSPTLGRLLTPDDDPVAVTADAMVVTVHFHQAVRGLAARGAEVFLECGAGEDAVALVRAIVPAATAASPLAAGGPWRPGEPLHPAVPLNTPAPNGSAPASAPAPHAGPALLLDRIGPPRHDEPAEPAQRDDPTEPAPPDGFAELAQRDRPAALGRRGEAAERGTSPQAGAGLVPAPARPGDADQEPSRSGTADVTPIGQEAGRSVVGGAALGQEAGRLGAAGVSAFGQGAGGAMVGGAAFGEVARPRLAPAPPLAPPLFPSVERMLPPATLLLCGGADVLALRALTDDRDDVVVADADTIDWTWLPLTPRHLRVVARPGPDAGPVHEAMIATAARFPHLHSIAALVLDALRQEVVPHPIAGLFAGTIQPLAAELAGCACVAVATADVDLPAALDVLAAELEAAPPLLAAFYQGPQRLLYELTPAFGDQPWQGNGGSWPSPTNTA